MKQPRNVRPSFVEIQVEGRKNIIRSGPRAKNGKMFISIYCRVRGEAKRAYTISLIPKEGKLEVEGINLMDDSHFSRCFQDSFDLD